MARKSRKPGAPALRSPEPKVFRAGLYVRLSKKKEREDTIQNQLELLMNYIADKSELSLAGTYVDNGRSGTTFARGGFERLLCDVDAGLIDCVIVKDLSRLGRNSVEAGRFIERYFPSREIRFIAVNDDYDTNAADHHGRRLAASVKNLMNEQYSRQQSVKLLAQKKAMKEAGLHCGSFAPYGYEKRDGRLCVDPAAASVVRDIFRWTLEGVSDGGIVKRLADNGAPPPKRYMHEKNPEAFAQYKGAVVWAKSSIARMTSNRVYIGALEQNKRYKRFGADDVITREAGEWIVRECAHEPIIDADTFERVQRIKAKRREKHEERIQKNRDSERWENPFAGLIYCGDCLRPLERRRTPQLSPLDYTFTCPYGESYAPGCSGKYVRERKVTAAVTEAVNAQMLLARNSEALIGSLGGHWLGGKKLSLERTVREDCRAIARCFDEKKRLVEARMIGGTAGDELGAALAGIGEREELHKRRMEASRRELAKLVGAGEMNPWLSPLEGAKASRLTAKDIRPFVRRILVFEGRRVEIELCWRDELFCVNAESGTNGAN